MPTRLGRYRDLEGARTTAAESTARDGAHRLVRRAFTRLFAAQAFHKAMATHPTRVHADHDAEATVEVNDADDGEVEESLDVRFTRLLEIGELEKQVRRRRRRMILFHHASPAAAPAYIAALAQLGRPGIGRAES